VQSSAESSVECREHTEQNRRERNVTEEEKEKD
jgi:hypothetical protein